MNEIKKVRLAEVTTDNMFDVLIDSTQTAILAYAKGYNQLSERQVNVMLVEYDLFKLIEVCIVPH